ncbi:DUF676-domain-containing protein [Coniophora puteana RWD-64-598 SS2]|uniref:DUF676-domain-containing protein n=1 Tax=Coniophora puteana (strain RWD-64-598) TaxID=741705 RepID=A0A5M3MJZ9_CONPW|nr:DUF676-domain-containing protein [Coniophora puteana RWD-64-598 SS2]EIW79386.1 DUF676-domain-containing protein [Coniophora puteana RWD-64-598 SS2]
MSNIHLLVLVHGMWGNPRHLAELDRIIREVKGDVETEDTKLAVLVAETNKEDSTYDGIDWGGERVAQEVFDEIKKHEDAGKKVTKFSITGYSLGGLIARYLIGILHQKQFFEKITPVNFNTIATPHIGIPRFQSTFSSIASFLGPRLLSRTGEQFFGVDKWSPSGRSLLEVLADPDHIFHQALVLFPNLRIYANALNDLTVPYVTAAIDDKDPFGDYENNGLEVEIDEKYKHIIISYNLPATPPPPKEEKKDTRSWWERVRTSEPPLPPIFPRVFPLNLVLYGLIPILLPTFISLALLRLSISSRKSRSRIKMLESDKSDKNPLMHIVAKLEADLETGIMDMYDEADASRTPQGTPESSDDITKELQVQPPLLTPMQRRCIDNLNKIPQLKKERAFFKDVRNAHAMIVCRDVKRFQFHEEGEGVLRHWADHFVLV